MIRSAMLLLLLATVAMSTIDRPHSLKMVVSTNSGTHKLEVRFEGRTVDLSRDRVVSIKGQWRLNGVAVLGTETGRIENVSTKVVARVDEVRFLIPVRLVRDVANMHFDDGKTVELTLSTNGKRFQIKMLGSDGAGGYYAVWHFANGRFTRQIVVP